MIQYLKNRKKMVLGFLAGAVVWCGLKLGLDVDPDLATLIAGAIFAGVVERARPIFGNDVEGPKELEGGQIVVKAPTDKLVDVQRQPSRR